MTRYIEVSLYCKTVGLLENSYRKRALNSTKKSYLILKLPSEDRRLLPLSLESGSLGDPVTGCDILRGVGLFPITRTIGGSSAVSNPPVESSVESGSGVTTRGKFENNKK